MPFQLYVTCRLYFFGSLRHTHDRACGVLLTNALTVSAYLS